jgi:hypothetical protein
MVSFSISAIIMLDLPAKKQIDVSNMIPPAYFRTGTFCIEYYLPFGHRSLLGVSRKKCEKKIPESIFKEQLRAIINMDCNTTFFLNTLKSFKYQ